jgi:uncharacterized membrane protein
MLRPVDTTEHRLLQEVRDDVADIRRALYEGNGKEALMTRVDRLEQRVQRVGGVWAFLQSLIVAVVTVTLTLLGTGAIG